jgi:hypothetical protein
MGDIDIDDNLSLFKHSLRSLALFFLAPLLAIAIWFIVFQGGTTGKYAIAAISFTIGLVTEEAIQAIISFARNILGGLKGITTPTTPSRSDTKSPTILYKSPNHKSTGVALKPTITSTFSEPIDKTTINPSTSILRDNNNRIVESEVHLSQDSRTASLETKNNLSSSTTYTVVITLEVKDPAGNSLVSEKWSFTTI